MSTGHHALTEKEKQTLRLLVRGYDAKSMARHLGLSVHTVNERLRDARRKMATSSSREAARLLREAEDQSPQLLGDESLGEVAAPVSAQPGITETKRGTGRVVWIAGGLIMSLTLALLALIAVDGSTEMAAPTKHDAGMASSTDEAAVVAAARQWLALVDARDWSGSWNAAASSGFKSHNTVEKWTSAAEQVHGKFGAARSRELISIESVPAPPNGYWLVKFKASYANKPQGTETLSLAREDGTWKVVGIYVD